MGQIMLPGSWGNKRITTQDRVLPVLIVLLICVSCSQGSGTRNEPIQEVEVSGNTFQTTLPSGLTIEAYELDAIPQAEPLSFETVAGISQQEVLLKHQGERLQVFPENFYFEGGNFSLSIPWDEGQMVAHVILAPPPEPSPGSLASLSIEVLQGEELLYTASAGSVSPLTPLQGLWSQGQDWVLEYAHVTVNYNEPENTATSQVVGHIIGNGESLNEAYGLEEAFGYQSMGGNPFYFFKLDGQIGISYDGDRILLGFDAVPHYNCCSASVLNPSQAENMVAFFAQKDGLWYYVEAGVFE